MESKQDNVDFIKMVDTITASNVGKSLLNIKKEFDRQVKINESLRRENKSLKDEAYKDNELQEMKRQLDNMREDYYRGFPISKSEMDAIKIWKENHKPKNRKRYCGGYTYEFVPTGLGISGTIKCNCGAEFEFQEIR